MKKTLALTLLVCAIGIMPIEIPTNTQDAEQSVAMNTDSISLIDQAAAFPPDCDDGMFSARCIRAIIMELFGGRDNW